MGANWIIITCAFTIMRIFFSTTAVGAVLQRVKVKVSSSPGAGSQAGLLACFSFF